jgi:hypothetical protein
MKKHNVIHIKKKEKKIHTTTYYLEDNVGPCINHETDLLPHLGLHKKERRKHAEEYRRRGSLSMVDAFVLMRNVAVCRQTR